MNTNIWPYDPEWGNVSKWSYSVKSKSNEKLKIKLVANSLTVYHSYPVGIHFTRAEE